MSLFFVFSLSIFSFLCTFPPGGERVEVEEGRGRES